MPLPRGRSASRRRWATGVPRLPISRWPGPSGLCRHDYPRREQGWVEHQLTTMKGK